MLRGFGGAVALLLAGALACPAQEARVFPDQLQLDLVINGQAVVIAREQDPEAVLTGDYARTARACPPDCIQPMAALPGGVTFGAGEVIAFLQTEVAGGGGVLLDIRLPSDFGASHLPGAVNVPLVLLSAKNPAQVEILKALGVQATADGTLDFESAPVLAVYGEGPFSPDPAEAVRFLAEAGYPQDRLRYFRGGLQEWLQFGLTLAAPADQG